MIARRPPTEGIALLMLDLDRFKQVNDTLGHQSGDDLIRTVAQRLSNLTGTRDTLARLGGDEFGVIHHARRGLADHLRLAEKMIDAIGKPFEIMGSEVFVGVSIGVVVIGESDTDRRDIARKADIALYEAKSAGRNRAVVYEETMDELLQNRRAIEAELREALRRTDQLSVAFQPLFDLKTGRITGAEALVRWTNPQLGKVSPCSSCRSPKALASSNRSASLSCVPPAPWAPAFPACASPSTSRRCSCATRALPSASLIS